MMKNMHVQDVTTKTISFFFQFNLVYTTNMFCYQQTLIDRQYEIYADLTRIGGVSPSKIQIS